MNTRRYPRTMSQAFGPYTSRDLHPMPQRVPTVNRIAGVLLAVAIGIFFALFAVHHLAK